MRLARELHSSGERTPANRGTRMTFVQDLIDRTRLYLVTRFGRLPHLLPRMNMLLGEICSHARSKLKTA